MRYKQWKVEPPDRLGIAMANTWWRVAAADDSTVAYCPDEETARLLAAAPQMQSALRSTYKELKDGGGVVLAELVEAIRASEGAP